MSAVRVLDPDVLAGLRGLSVRVDAVVEGVLAGLHRSPFRGASSEFAEHKEYAAGDELRTVDWKLLGRTDRYYVKQFHDETNLACHLVIDQSASMGFGAPLSKHDYAAVLAGSLAYLLAGQIDMVGLGLAAPAGLAYTPPRTGRVHLQHVIDELAAAAPGAGAGDLAAAIDGVADRARRRSLVFVFSDLLVDFDATLSALGRLASRPAEVVVLQVLSPEELTFPYAEAARFRDPEDGAELPLDPEAVRAHYQRELDAFLARWREACLERGMRYQLVDTSRAPERVLRALLGREASR
jgi:uncharacterized protein (DUF58 family)